MNELRETSSDVERTTLKPGRKKRSVGDAFVWGGGLGLGERTNRVTVIKGSGNNREEGEAFLEQFSGGGEGSAGKGGTSVLKKHRKRHLIRREREEVIELKKIFVIC